MKAKGGPKSPPRPNRHCREIILSTPSRCDGGETHRDQQALHQIARWLQVADKIANLRDVADNPPANWSIQRRQQYFDWARRVVDAIPEVPPPLRKLFDDTYARSPTIGELSKAAGFKENKQPGLGITLVGPRPSDVR